MFNNALLMAAASAAASVPGRYVVDYSCRFNTADTAVLSRANGTATSSTTATIAFWFKIGVIGVDRAFFGEEGFYTGCAFLATGQLYVVHNGAIVLTTTQVFRDPSAWYHCVCVFDTTEGSSVDRFKMYINGAQVTDYTAGTFPTASEAFSAWNTSGNTNLVGDGHSTYANYDGYLSEFHSTDGTAYGPTTFGEFNNGVWRPIEVSGVTYGNNGFYFDFADSSDLGNDVSGNDNDFTSSGLVAADQMTDTPTTNFCTWSPIDKSASVTLSDGNLVGVFGASWVNGRATFGIPSSGKWSLQIQSSTLLFYIGIVAEGQGDGDLDTSGTDALYYYANEPYIRTYRSGSAVNETTNVPPKVAVDTNMELLIDKDNDQIGVVIADTVYMAVDAGVAIQDTMTKIFIQGYNTTVTTDFGQGGYEPSQTGYKALSTANLDEPTIKNSKKYFDTILYEGNGLSQKVGQFQPITETYSVGNSALFIEDDDCFLSRTPGSAGNRRTWTFSTWFKRCELTTSVDMTFFAAYGANSDAGYLTCGIYNNTDQIYIEEWTAMLRNTTRQFSDPTQWVNLVVAYDSTQTTAGDRVKMYINGIEETSFGTSNDPTEDGDTPINNTVLQQIGRRGYSDDRHLDAYMAETVMIDGTRLDASSFGEVDSTTNRWIPKDVSGLTFGTNGYYLDYADKNDLGDDESGNTNDFAESGFDTTNGSNQYYDTPTRNFSILDPGRGTSTSTYSNGNLTQTSPGAATGAGTTPQPFGLTSGKWYWEMRMDDGTNNERSMIMIQNDVLLAANTWVRSRVGTYSGYRSYAGNAITSGDISSTTGESTTYGDSYTSGDVLSCAIDLDIGAIWWAKNGTWQASATEAEIEAGDTSNAAQSGLASGAWYPCVQNNDSWSTTVNFGQWIYYDSTTLTLDTTADGYFRYGVPDGFKAINVDALTESDSFQSAFSWIKNRDATDAHMLFDRVRGPYSFWNSNDDADIADDVDTLTRFLKQGANIGNDVRVNTFNESYVYWDWFIESTGSGASNEDGTINTTSTLVDTTSGVSISKFTGTGANATVGHGLGAAPKFLILKHFDNTNYSTPVWHNKFSTPTTGLAYLDTYDAQSAAATAWNSTIPTSSVVSLGTGASTNNSGTDYMMYCFAEIEGFSKFGSYVGNANDDGPVIYTGMKPSFLLVKGLGARDWFIFDNKRNTFNVVNENLTVNEASATGTSYKFDFLSNGFKVRLADGGINTSGETYVYAVFAQNPFGGASTTPGTAF